MMAVQTENCASDLHVLEEELEAANIDQVDECLLARCMREFSSVLRSNTKAEVASDAFVA